jgi:hypothetical protein
MFLSLLVINLSIIMFCMSFVTLTQFCPPGLNVVYHGFKIWGIVQECNHCKLQGFAVVTFKRSNVA